MEFASMSQHPLEEPPPSSDKSREVSNLKVEPQGSRFRIETKWGNAELSGGLAIAIGFPVALAAWIANLYFT